MRIGKKILIFSLVGLLAVLTVAAARHTLSYYPADDAPDFKLGVVAISGWPSGTTDVAFSVNTRGSGDMDDDGYIDSDDVMAALAAVDAGFNAWEIAGFTYTIAPTGDANPCGGTNSVSWAAIDGTGGILAKTNACRDLVTKDIVGFTMIFDSAEDWSNAGAFGQHDLQSLTAHEAGHVTGLDHIHDSEAKRLTMFFSAQTGNRGPRTLGCGDRLGVNALYGTTLDCTTLPGD